MIVLLLQYEKIIQKQTLRNNAVAPFQLCLVFYPLFPIALNIKDPNGIKLFWATLGTLAIFLCFVFLKVLCNIFSSYCNSTLMFLALKLYMYTEYPIKSINQSIKIAYLWPFRSSQLVLIIETPHKHLGLNFSSGAISWSVSHHWSHITPDVIILIIFIVRC